MEPDVSTYRGRPYREKAGATSDPENVVRPVIPDHVLLRRIGSGSYGTVWLARNMMGMFRAVKIVYQNSFSDRHPFERELAGIRKFEPISRSHEGFVDVLQVGMNEEQGYFYYIMEVADDQLLGQKICPDTYRPKTLAKEIHLRGKLSFQECLELGLALSLALSELNKHGLVHRDVKPSNIIFVHGVPKLADIGLVTEANQAQSFVGTAGFIPPEGPGSPQADVYSLGKVLYEASTGKDRQDFPELPTLLDTLADQEKFLELNEVILQACKNEVAQRYQSAWNLHAELLVLANGKSIRRLKALERRLSRLKRVASVSFLVLVFAAFIAYQVYRERKLREDAHQRDVGAAIAYGNQAMESGDLLGAVPYFADALQLDQRNLYHRMRLGALLAECPKLTQMCFEGMELEDGQFSPDGRCILVSQHGGAARIYDVQSGKLVRQPFGPNYLRRASYSTDGHLIVTASEDGFADVWDAATLKRLHHWLHPMGVESAMFAPDGFHVITACVDGNARLWNTLTENVELQFHVGARIRCAIFSKDGRFIATASTNYCAQVWDASTGRKIGKPLQHDGWVNCADFSPDGTKLVTACGDHRARVWDVATGRKISADLLHRDDVSSAEFSPDGRLILTASLDGTVRLWQADTFEPFEPNPVLRHGEKVLHASFDPEGRRILSVCEDGTVRVWDLAGSALPSRIPRSVFSFDGEKSLEITNGTVQMQNLSTAASKLLVCPYSTEKANFSRNGRFAFTVSSVQTNKGPSCRSLLVWNATTGEAVASQIVLTNRCNEWAISDDGRRLAVISRGSLRFWDVQKGAPFAAIFTNQHAIRSVLFSPTGLEAAVIADKAVYIVNTTNAQAIFPPLVHAQRVGNVDFSPDGKRLVSCCNDPYLTRCYAQVWNVTDGRPAGPKLMHGDGVRFVCFSPDGTRIATAGEDFTGAIWDAVSGLRLATLPHNEKVQSIRFNSDGTEVVTASLDSTARIWSADTGDPLSPPFIHTEKLAGAQFVAGGRQIATIDKGGVCCIWDLPQELRKPEEVRKLGRLLSSEVETATRSLTPLPADSLAIFWEHMRTAYPPEFSTSAGEIAAWNEQEARDSEAKNEWAAAVFHLERLMSSGHGTPDVAKRLADARSHLNDINQ